MSLIRTDPILFRESIAAANKQFAALEVGIQSRIARAAERGVAKVAEREAKAALDGVGTGALRRSIGVSTGNFRRRRVTFVGIVRRKSVTKQVNRYAAVQEYGGWITVRTKTGKTVRKQYRGKGFLARGRRAAIAQANYAAARIIDDQIKKQMIKVSR